MEQEIMKRRTAANERFGVMAAVAPRKVQCEFGSLYPAGNSVEAATTPSRWDVSSNGRNGSARLESILKKKYFKKKCHLCTIKFWKCS